MLQAPRRFVPASQPCGTDSMTLANQQIGTAMEKSGNRFDWVHKRLDTGEDFPAEVLLNAMELDGKQVLQAVVRDISERKKAEQALKTAKKKRRWPTSQKSQFLASMSHELRTPLTGILGFTDLLLGSLSKSRRDANISRPFVPAEVLLLELINDILDLSKIEAAQLEIVRASCSPHRILERRRQHLAGPAQRKGLRLDCRWSGSVPSTIETDGLDCAKSC